MVPKARLNHLSISFDFCHRLGVQTFAFQTLKQKQNKLSSRNIWPTLAMRVAFRNPPLAISLNCGQHCQQNPPPPPCDRKPMKVFESLLAVPRTN